MRSVVQIGIGGWAEYLPLTHEDWLKGWEDSEHNCVPERFTESSEPFYYYGVDVSPTVIAAISKRFLHNPRAEWICVGVGDRFTIDLAPKRSIWIANEDPSIACVQTAKTENVCYTLIPMHVLINNLHLESFEILAVDIDGFEYFIFDNLESWNILPTYISVEIHEIEHLLETYPIESVDATILKDPEGYIKQQLEAHGYRFVGRLSKPPETVTDMCFMRE